MTNGKSLSSLRGLVVLTSLVALTGCSGGGGSGGSDFALTAVSVSNNSIWRINRAIEFTFSKPVDLNTVNLNTVQIREVFGAPSSGEFSYKQDPTDSTKVLKNVVVFQPVCPKLAVLLRGPPTAEPMR